LFNGFVFVVGAHLPAHLHHNHYHHHDNNQQQQQQLFTYDRRDDALLQRDAGPNVQAGLSLAVLESGPEAENLPHFCFQLRHFFHC